MPKRIRLAWGACLAVGACLAGCGDDDSGPDDAAGDLVDTEVAPDVPIDVDAPDADADAPPDVPIDGDDVPADAEPDGHDGAFAWPRVAGNYLLSADFVPPESLPDPVTRLTDALGELLRSPGGPLVRLLAVTACELDAECTDYGTHSYFDYIFDPPASAGGEPSLNAYGAVVATILEANLLAGIRALRPEAGATLEEILGPGGEVFENAEGWRLEGRLQLIREADAAGQLGTENTVACHQAIWRWNGAAAAFLLRDDAPVTAAGIEAALVPYPPVAPDGSHAILLAPFDLRLDYAALLVRVLESVVFPETIDPAIDSFEELFGFVIDCRALGDDLAARGGTYELLAPRLETACAALALSATAYLRAWLDERTGGVSGYLRLASPADGPCPAGEAAGPTGAVVERFGEDRDGARCRWEGTSRFDEVDVEPVAVAWTAIAE